MQPFIVQLYNLFLIQLTNWRWSWRSAITLGMIAPVLSMVAFSAFIGKDDTEALQYILTGNLVFSLLFGTTDKIASNFAFMRATGSLDFFATLPLYRVALILASAAAFLLLTLPNVIVFIILGSFLLDVNIVISPLIIVIIPLIGFALCGLGALIGTLNRPMEEVGSISSLVSFLMLFIGPVMIPAERLHPIIQGIGYFSPATYAASALRHVLLAEPQTIPLAIDVIMLLLIMGGLLWWSARRMNWRQLWD